jgi:hypothetical protein
MSRGHGRAQRFLLAEITEPGCYHSADPLRAKYAIEAGCSPTSAEAALRRAARRLADEGRLDVWHDRGMTWFGLPGTRWQVAEARHESGAALRRAFGVAHGVVEDYLSPTQRPSSSCPGTAVDAVIRGLLADEDAVATVDAVIRHIGADWPGHPEALADMIRRRVRGMADVHTYPGRAAGCGCLCVYGDTWYRDADRGSRQCLALTRARLERFDRFALPCDRHG